MKPIQILFTGLLLASLLPGCEIHDDIDVDVKRKAIVYLRYNYNDGEHDTMDEVQTLRLFFFDLKTGRQYRDTTLTRDEFLTDTGAMQTYISNGEYGIVTLANVGHGSSVSARQHPGRCDHLPGYGCRPAFLQPHPDADPKGRLAALRHRPVQVRIQGQRPGRRDAEPRRPRRVLLQAWTIAPD